MTAVDIVALSITGEIVTVPFAQSNPRLLDVVAAIRERGGEWTQPGYIAKAVVRFDASAPLVCGADEEYGCGTWTWQPASLVDAAAAYEAAGLSLDDCLAPAGR